MKSLSIQCLSIPIRLLTNVKWGRTLKQYRIVGLNRLNVFSTGGAGNDWIQCKWDLLRSFCCSCRAAAESSLTYAITVWFGNVSADDRRQLDKVVRIAQRIIWCDFPPLAEVYEARLQKEGLNSPTGWQPFLISFLIRVDEALRPEHPGPRIAHILKLSTSLTRHTQRCRPRSRLNNCATGQVFWKHF